MTRSSSICTQRLVKALEMLGYARRRVHLQLRRFRVYVFAKTGLQLGIHTSQRIRTIVTAVVQSRGKLSGSYD